MNWPVAEVLVVNASPLIFLGNAGRLDLLRATRAGRIVVPGAVLAEVTSGGHADTAARALAAAGWVEHWPTPKIPASVAAWDLGAGEASVIASALEWPGAHAVIDDLLGRKCASTLGVRVIGTLGVVMTAHRRGVVSDPHAVRIELRSAGMWLSDAVVERALRVGGLDR